jgi:hypothetical protein
MRPVVLAALMLLPMAVQARTTCPASLHGVRTVELFFGQDEGGRQLSAAEWKRFVDTEITPRFPDGLTVLDAYGQWRAPDGILSREPTKVVLIILAGRPGDAAGLAAIRAAYKSQFHQQSVLLVEHSDCASF